MTVAELISVLEEMDPTRLICIKHPDATRGYYPAGEEVWQTTVSHGDIAEKESYDVVVLELSPWDNNG